MPSPPEYRPLPDRLPPQYFQLLTDLKHRVRAAQVRAACAVTRELVLLYWNMGRRIAEAEQMQGWGAGVVVRLSADLRAEFPDTTGFSPRNLRYMRDLAQAWPDEAVLQQTAAKLPWGHLQVLLDRLKDQELRNWYAGKALTHGWSRDVLALQIETRLHDREGRALSNFHRVLPPEQSDLATSLLKDPYNFDFLTLSREAREHDLEQGLIDHVQKTLLELGTGFALVGRQVPIEVDGEDFRLDLLFYHLDLRCFVVVELKAKGFRPEFAGKLNFYLSVVDDRFRRPGDAPTLGLLLSRGKRGAVVEYALRDIGKPIAVADWTARLLETLPEPLKQALCEGDEDVAPGG